MAYYDKNETAAQVILDAVVAEFVLQGFSLPTRRVLGYAGMPLDCEQLTVYVARMYQVNQAAGPESEAIAAERCVFWAGTEYDVVLTRCTPQPAPRASTLLPVPESVLETFAAQVMRDPHVIARGVLNAFRAGNLGLGGNIAFLDTANIADEAGLLISLRLRVRVGNAF